MTAPTATAARGLPTPCTSPAPCHRNDHPAAVAVLVVAALLVAVLTAAAMCSLTAELAAFALLGSWAGAGLIVVMAGLPLLLEIEDRSAQGEPSDDRHLEHPDRKHTRSQRETGESTPSPRLAKPADIEPFSVSPFQPDAAGHALG